MPRTGRIRKSLWIDNVRELVEQCADADGNRAPELALQLFDLVSYAPGPIMAFLGSRCDRRTFIAYIENGAIECALFDLFGTNTSFVLSKSAVGQSIVTIHLDGLIDEVNFVGRSIALAMIGGLASGLLEAVEAVVPPVRRVRRQMLN